MSSLDEISRIREENFERAVSAVGRDDVDALKDVLDVLPEFNTMVDRDGRNLLTLSCVFRNKKAFDYLLNLNCFDLETVDSGGYSALVRAMNHDCDYFSVKLINEGADVFKIGPDGRTYLHHAMHYYLLETAELLLQKGVDPNAQNYNGRTSLHITLAYNTNPKVDEGVDLLLQYGADTGIRDDAGHLPFEYAVIHGKKLSIQEHLFYCTFDSHSADYEMQSDVFDELLDAPDYANVSPLFDNVMDVVSEVNLKRRIKINFFTTPPDILKKIVEKYSYIIRRAFLEMELISKAMNINNLEILLNSELHFETVHLISRLDLSTIYLDNRRISREERSNLILYLLSYGFKVTNYDCKWIYKFQGHSDLLKTMLLHLDYTDASTMYTPMIMIIVDIYCDLSTILARFDRFSCYEIEPLLDNFANSELRLLCERTGKPNLVNKVKQLPKVPSLLQLARDETRRHIVRRLKLKKTSQYYWVLRRLGIGTTYEDILSFKTKLYGYHKY